jgi:hypothetical protein
MAEIGAQKIHIGERRIKSQVQQCTTTEHVSSPDVNPSHTFLQQNE